MSQDYVGSLANIVITGATTFFTGDILDADIQYAKEEVDVSVGSATSGHGEYGYGTRTSVTMRAKIRLDPGVDPLTILALAPAQCDITYKDAAATVHRYSAGKVYSIDATFPATGRIEADCQIRLAGTRTVNPV